MAPGERIMRRMVWGFVFGFSMLSLAGCPSPRSSKIVCPVCRGAGEFETHDFLMDQPLGPRLVVTGIKSCDLCKGTGRF